MSDKSRQRSTKLTKSPPDGTRGERRGFLSRLMSRLFRRQSQNRTPTKEEVRAERLATVNKIAQKYNIPTPERQPDQGTSLKTEMDKNQKALRERGDKLAQLGDKTQKMEDEAANFAATSRQLAAKYQN